MPKVHRNGQNDECYEKKDNINTKPKRQPIRKTYQEFEVSEHLVRKARKLWREKGLLAKPDIKKGQQILQNVKGKGLEFYKLDDSNRLCPVNKDFVSVFLNSKKKIHKEKRLILLHCLWCVVRFGSICTI